MSQAGIWVTTFMVGVYRADTVFWWPRSPWKSEFGTYAQLPSRESATVVGNMPTSARPSRESPSTVYFQIDPNGLPCAIDTYQNRPSGETATLCGPLVSFGTSFTDTSRAFFHPSGPTSMRVTMSAPSLEM